MACIWVLTGSRTPWGSLAQRSPALGSATVWSLQCRYRDARLRGRESERGRVRDGKSDGHRDRDGHRDGEKGGERRGGHEGTEIGISDVRHSFKH